MNNTQSSLKSRPAPDRTPHLHTNVPVVVIYTLAAIGGGGGEHGSTGELVVSVVE